MSDDKYGGPDFCAGCCDSYCRHADWCIGIRGDSRKAPRSVYVAAPDLYTVVKAALPLVEDYLQGVPELAEQMEAAIAKAEGR